MALVMSRSRCKKTRPEVVIGGGSPFVIPTTTDDEHPVIRLRRWGSARGRPVASFDVRPKSATVSVGVPGQEVDQVSAHPVFSEMFAPNGARAE